MIDRHERFSEGIGESLRKGYAHEERAQKSRAVSDRHRVDIFKIYPRVLHRAGNHRGNRVRMRAGGNFRNHAAVKGLNIRRRRDFVRENFSAAYHRGCRLVARRFDAENDRGGFIEIGGGK